MYDRENKMYEIATLYYTQGLTQVEIAKKTGISRPTVSAILKDALKEGIVTISVKHPINRKTQLEKIISEKYQIETVLITPTFSSRQETKKELAQKTADFVAETIDNYETIGLGWGTTIKEFVDVFQNMDSNVKKIVPLIGGFGVNDVQYHANHLSFILGEKLNSDVTYFYAPAIVKDSEIFDTFMKSTLVTSIFDLSKNIDLAIVSLTNPLLFSTMEKIGYISQTDKEEFKTTKTVGNILGSFYNDDGEEVHNSFSEKMIGLKLKELKEIKEVLLIATGEEKKRSVKSLLTNNFVSHLIIDSDIAEYLGNLNNSEQHNKI